MLESIPKAMRLAGAAAVLFGATAAQAQLLTGSTSPTFTPVGFSAPPVVLPAEFDLTKMVTGAAGALSLTSVPASLTFTYLGSEAGHTNLALSVYTPSGGLFSNAFSAIGAAFTISSPALTTGPVHFAFVDTASPVLLAVNGGLNAASIGYIKSSTNPNAWLLAFNDRGGDADFDDMVVRVTAVPEPGTYAMLLAGLGLLGYMARRRMRGER